MRYAIVSNMRSLPSPEQTGVCPTCRGPVIAKCGALRVHHWAHRGEWTCDNWWESRTEWHCEWQDKFPQACQEVIRFSPSGEKHIADVHTERGLTVEFQYSHLRPEERAARESFYDENLIWVVNGARLKHDFPRFVKGTHSFRPIWKKGVYVCDCPDEVFPKNWLNCTRPVLFDFENAFEVDEVSIKLAYPLWCLLPGRIGGYAVVLRVPRGIFIRWALERSRLLRVQGIVRDVSLALVAEQVKQAVTVRLQAMPMRQFRRSSRRRGWSSRYRPYGPGPRM